ncbi:uncharacterized protein BX664DRAFT_335656 [Halteromyces radiatus]|uniref:uncharacterized protein n=1 Tax=Halteromyces radiatus TaxID=101107 RepID=UPI00222090F8|nr:uncharacterized protein BX664DRAFT_335656 [Halteromyces radiatus]KAI8086378.1 hypothetical protein BX664DRAFT_335656 [Halteromyces radiatus]
MSTDSPIAQVPDPNTDYEDDLIYQQNDEDDGFEQDAIPQILKLDLRGVRVELDRDTLVSLPESLLIAMFPNGLILGGRQDEYEDEDYDRHSRDSVGNGDKSSSSGNGSSQKDEDDDFQVTYVDFDPVCLEYVLQFYRQAQQLSNELQQQRLTNSTTTTETTNSSNENGTSSLPPAMSMSTSPAYYPLLDKQPIIVLREELEYFCVPSQKKLPVADMATLKLQCGQYLRHHDEIFAALQKSIARENNMAEQHLIDMLCDAGFSRNDRWGHRALEPMRTCIISMGLVLLKTTGPDNHMPTAQKLLLFWRKPARKCWWDGNTVDIQGQTVRLWARRTWCLELALV